jgi:NADH-quinone oxidoreductase subunit A
VGAGAAQQLWPLVLYGALALLVVGAMLGLSAVLGQKHAERDTGQPYESGIVSTGSTRIRFDVQFYLVATFFVVFDLEAMFVFVWAMGLRAAGWSGFGAMCFFILMLAIALGYLWREGALDWGPDARRKQMARRARRTTRGEGV